ncbi:MAG: hypothetical protein HUJ74_00035 [Lachnospiraceae bacterium]|nr:hypothetical protein [Lachnospiraceae bacterium]
MLNNVNLTDEGMAFRMEDRVREFGNEPGCNYELVHSSEICWKKNLRKCDEERRDSEREEQYFISTFL